VAGGKAPQRSQLLLTLRFHFMHGWTLVLQRQQQQQ
jgi:hypothetical protein